MRWGDEDHSAHSKVHVGPGFNQESERQVRKEGREGRGKGEENRKVGTIIARLI